MNYNCLSNDDVFGLTLMAIKYNLKRKFTQTFIQMPI